MLKKDIIYQLQLEQEKSYSLPKKLSRPLLVGNPDLFQKDNRLFG
jgi:hypothetical protein